MTHENRGEGKEKKSQQTPFIFYTFLFLLLFRARTQMPCPISPVIWVEDESSSLGRLITKQARRVVWTKVSWVFWKQWCSLDLWTRKLCESSEERFCEFIVGIQGIFKTLPTFVAKLIFTEIAKNLNIALLIWFRASDGFN